MLYPVTVEKRTRKRGFILRVPDLPGCVSTGGQMEEGLQELRDQLESQLHGLLEDGQPLPKPTSLRKLRKKKKYRQCAWALVDINEHRLAGKVRRINITMPERILDMVDRAAGSEGATRSGFLARAALAYISGKP